MKGPRASGVYVERFGSGPDLVMLHGWAMHGGLLRDLAERLSACYRVSLIDLPGHGGSGPIDDYSLASVTDKLLEVAPSSAHWLGWSLGALLAIGVESAHPGRVRSLAMIAGSPRFTAGIGWPGVDLCLLEQMASNLEQDFSGTLKRFIALQVFSQDNARELTKRIQEIIDERPVPDAGALRGGLALLRGADFRPVLAAFQKPVLAILGAQDRLVPKAVAPELLQLNADMEVHELFSAAHLPFLTHPEETASLIREFMFRQDQG